MKTNWRPHRLACLLVATLAWTSLGRAASPGPAAPEVQVRATVGDQAVRLEVTSSGPFEYTAYRLAPQLFVVDLKGTAPGASEIARVLDSPIVSSYRLLQYEKDGGTTVRLEVLLRTPVQPRVERQGSQGLVLTFAPAHPAAQAREAASAARPATVEPVAAAPPGSGTGLIQHVQLASVNQRPEVRVEGDRPLAFHTLRLGSPERLVLDFSGARLAIAPKPITSAIPPVSGIRMSQFRADTVRVVVALEQHANYQVRADQSAVIVDFNSSPGEKVNATKGNENSSASFHAGPARLVPARASSRESRLPLPETLTQPSAALASPAPAARPQSAEDPEAKPAAAPAPAQSPSAEPAPTTAAGSAGASPPAATPEPAPAPAPEPTRAAVVPQASAPQGGAKYTGEPISVNLKDVDLKDFFRLIHEISGLNVVLDPSVKGTLTIVLDEVPWDQALEIVLRNNGLDKQLEGNVLRIATKDTLKKEAEQQRDLAKAQAEAADQITTTRVLSYAKASDIKETLKKFLSSRGDILADSRSNTLIIKDIPSVMPVVDNLIRQLDRKSQQVEIEARVVLASRNFARDIGTQFGFAVAGATGNSRNVVGGAEGVGISSIVRNTSAFLPTGVPAPPLVSASGTATIPGTSGNPIPLNANLGAAGPTSGVSFAHTEPNLALDFILTAAETKGVGKILSKPRVITQNNEKAEVKQGTKIPVQTVINNTISVQFVDAVLRLQVTPQITADGTVFMDVLVENTSIDPSIPRVQGIPALDTQSAETKVLINDGGTVVIGGIIISTQRTDISQVPLFGSIPLIGHLFRRTQVSTSGQELLFFLTPRILPS